MTLSDQYRTAAKAWAEADGKARELEAKKEPTLWRMAKARIDEAATRNVTLTITAAEREVKASPEWEAFAVNEVAHARTEANKLRGEMDSLMIKHEEAIGAVSRGRAA